MQLMFDEQKEHAVGVLIEADGLAESDIKMATKDGKKEK